MNELLTLNRIPIDCLMSAFNEYKNEPDGSVSTVSPRGPMSRVVGSKRLEAPATTVGSRGSRGSREPVWRCSERPSGIVRRLIDVGGNPPVGGLTPHPKENKEKNTFFLWGGTRFGG